MNKNTARNHPYMTRSKTKTAYVVSECKKKPRRYVPQNPYISHTDGIKLYMNRGVSSDDEYVTAEYEEAVYMSQMPDVPPVAVSIVENIKKIEEEPKKADVKTIEEEYVLL